MYVLLLVAIFTLAMTWETIMCWCSNTSTYIGDWCFVGVPKKKKKKRKVKKPSDTYDYEALDPNNAEPVDVSCLCAYNFNGYYKLISLTEAV